MNVGESEGSGIVFQKNMISNMNLSRLQYFLNITLFWNVMALNQLNFFLNLNWRWQLQKQARMRTTKGWESWHLCALFLLKRQSCLQDEIQIEVNPLPLQEKALLIPFRHASSVSGPGLIWLWWTKIRWKTVLWSHGRPYHTVLRCHIRHVRHGNDLYCCCCHNRFKSFAVQSIVWRNKKSLSQNCTPDADFF